MAMRKLLFFLFVSFSITASANDSVWVKQVDKPLDAIYLSIYKGLEAAGFFIVLEPDIGKNISRFSTRWGDDYNRNGLSKIRSMVFCNGWYANQVGNADPEMLALCPLHITLTEKGGSSKILFVRPAFVAKGSGAESIAAEIENKVINAITTAINSLSASSPISPATAASGSTGN
jgi:hypothetical protein